MMLGCKEISSIRAKKCKAFLVERQDSKYYLLVYGNKINADMQYDMLRQLRVKGMRVPKLLNRVDNELLLEYIEGRTLYEELCTGPVFKVGMFAQGLVKTLQDFCRLMPGKRMGNIDLRGYLAKGSVLYSVDFDCIVNGTLTEAVADAIVSTLADEIPQDRKIAFAKAVYRAAQPDAADFDKAFGEIADLVRPGGKLKESNEALLAAIR